MQSSVAALLGTVLAGYRLEAIIGTGGSGAVFRAIPIAGQGDPVAIKLLILPWQASDADRAAYYARFRREIQVLSGLHHPHILPIYAAGETGDFIYMVMPLMVGGSLYGRLRRAGHLPLSDISRYLDQLAAALDYAHAKGVIHRDLKPANILIDARNQVALADFGIVRLTMAKWTTLTADGHVVGTPGYMAPELIRGQAAGTAADIYGLGMLVYELVTGQPAFDGPTAVETMLMQVHQELPSPTIRRPDLPSAAADVIMHALAKDPNERYPNAAAFAIAFRQSLTPDWNAPTKPTPLHAVPPLPPIGPAPALPTPPAMPTRRTRSGVARLLAALGLAIALVGSGLFVMLHQTTAIPAPSRAARSTTSVPATATTMPTATVTRMPTTAPPSPTATLASEPTATPVPLPIPGEQLLVNPGFESYTGWCVWNNDTNQFVGCDSAGYHFYEEAYVPPADGHLYGVHYAADTSYDVTTYQGITTSVAGYYFVALRVWSTCGTTNVLFFKDTTTGQASPITDAGCRTGGWTAIAAGPLYVPAGDHIAIQIRSRNGPGNYFRFDQAQMCYATTPQPCV